MAAFSALWTAGRWSTTSRRVSWRSIRTGSPVVARAGRDVRARNQRWNTSPCWSIEYAIDSTVIAVTTGRDSVARSTCTNAVAAAGEACTADSTAVSDSHATHGRGGSGVAVSRTSNASNAASGVLWDMPTITVSAITYVAMLSWAGAMRSP